MLAIFWGACGGAQDGPEDPNGQVNTVPANTVGEWGGVQPTAYPTAASTPFTPPPVPPPPPPSEQECRARAQRPVAYDVTGTTDLQSQFGRFFDAHHETFRCCFDALEAPNRVNFSAKVSLIVRVEADGKFAGAEFGPGSAPLMPPTSKCITDVASMLNYPAPIGGKPAGYNRVFDFKARR